MPYFPPFLDDKGLHTPIYSDIRDMLISEYKRIFGTDENGEDIYLGEDTQDYQLISLYARCMDDAMSALQDAYTMRNPNYAYGNSLDLILPINGIKRHLATNSRALLTLTGRPTAQLPANLQAMDENNHIWRIESAVLLDESGQGQSWAVCLTLGNIQAPANTITKINTPVADWYDVMNLLPAEPGQDIESDAQAKARRAVSVGLPAKSVMDGIIAALQNVPGIKRSALYENKTSETDSNGIPGHSICAVAEEGNQVDIAKALLLKKSPGVGTYGDINVNVQDDYGEENAISFFRPIEANIYINIALKKLSGWDDTMIDSIKARVADYAQTVGIGENYIVSYLWALSFAASGMDIPPYAIQSITAQKGEGGTPATDNILLLFNEAAYCDQGNITITATD